MEIIDRGSGAALVLVPGIQGRWEYLRPAVDALAASARVLTFQLCGERRSGQRLDRARALDQDADQIVRLLDDRGIGRALICGVSFGGIIALRFAAIHPNRTAGLILASTPGPTFQLSRRHRLYVRAPWLFVAAFLAESPLRLRREIAAALPRWRDRRRFLWWQVSTLVTAPLSVRRMASRAVLIANSDRASDARLVTSPTLIVTGERALDYVVPVGGTSEYLRLIEHVRAATLERTGHLGSITRPEAFAALVLDFISRDVQVDQPRAVPEAAARLGRVS